MVLGSLAQRIRTPAIIVALFGYRVIHFLVPLALATAIWIIQEMRHWGRAARWW